MVGSWRLVASGGWQAVGGGRRLVGVGGWRLVVPWGGPLRAVLSKKKNPGAFRTALVQGFQFRDDHLWLPQ